MPWWRRWTRQVLPRHSARSCCWYHGGDWHTVNAMALEVLRWAHAQGVDPEGMEGFATAHAAAAGAMRWETEALATLFNIANAIQPDEEVRYINGQHRSQAMLEAGCAAPSSCATYTRRSHPGGPRLSAAMAASGWETDTGPSSRRRPGDLQRERLARQMQGSRLATEQGARRTTWRPARDHRRRRRVSR